MSFDFRLPNITAKDDAGKLQQMQSFLFQLVEQLNYAMKMVDGESTGAVPNPNQSSVAAGEADVKAQNTFNSIKSLIIKSADIVSAYYETINTRLKGQYVAESDFGTYTEETDARIEANSKGIEQHYTDIQQILSDIEDFEDTYIKDEGYIKTGKLGYDEKTGAAIYGLEIGQSTEKDGEEIFNKYARFTSDELSFYDSNDNKVAYISDQKLYITHVEVTGSFSLGAFIQKVRSDKTVVEKWAGGDG